MLWLEIPSDSYFPSLLFVAINMKFFKGMNNNRNYRYESLKNLLYLSVWYYRCIFRSNMLFQICEPALILINNYIFLLNLFSIRLIYLHFWEYLINSHKYTCGNFFIFYLFIYFFCVYRSLYRSIYDVYSNQFSSISKWNFN